MLGLKTNIRTGKCSHTNEKLLTGKPLQYSCLENPMDRGSWQAIVHGVEKSRTRLSDFNFNVKSYLLRQLVKIIMSCLRTVPGMWNSWKYDSFLSSEHDKPTCAWDAAVGALRFLPETSSSAVENGSVCLWRNGRAGGSRSVSLWESPQINLLASMFVPGGWVHTLWNQTAWFCTWLASWPWTSY